jgi:hypothetical protein
MKKQMQSNPAQVAFQTKENPQQFITVQHLEDFHKKLMTDLEQLLEHRLNFTPKKWLRSYEVRKMLNISPGTLQHLKASGTITFSKVGGSHYYNYQKIQELLASNDILNKGDDTKY